MPKTRRNYSGNAVSTTTTSLIASSGTTSFTVANYSGWPSGVDPFFIVLEPGTGNEEKMLVTRVGSTDNTIVIYTQPTVAANRGADDTSAVGHSIGSTVFPVFTAVDADEANELVSTLTSKGDFIVHGSATSERFPVGANNFAIVADSAQGLGVKWGQIQAAGIADAAVTSSKIDTSAVTTTKIANGAVTADKLAAGAIPSSIPTGVISPYAGSSAPSGWLLCDGSTVSQTTYATLYALVTTVYNTGGESAGTFRLPNLKGRVPVGRDSADVSFDTLGEQGGAKTHQLTINEMPNHGHIQDPHTHTQTAHTHTQQSHNHTQNGHTHTQNAHSHTQASHDHRISDNLSLFAPGGASSFPFFATVNYYGVGEASFTRSVTPKINSSTASNNLTTPTNQAATAINNSATAVNNNAVATNQTTGGSVAHNNLQPYLVINYIIKT